MKRIEINDTGIFHEEPGYVGWFTREQAAGAWENGTTVEKIRKDPTDDHAIGERAIILGSIRNPAEPGLGIMYFVEWDRTPGYAVACIDWKLDRIVKR